MNKRAAISDMRKAIQKGKMNANLKKAIQATIKALQDNNMELAYELSAVKSLISGVMKPSKENSFRYNFREDNKYNKRVLGESIYSIMDGIHHDIAFATGGLPSGMMVVTTYGIREKARPKKKHPIIAMMEKELKAIRSRKY